MRWRPSFREAGASPEAADDLLPTPGASRPLGDFLILRQIGRGGMGVVYEAQQLSARPAWRPKVLPFATAMDPRHLQRFKNEERAAGSTSTMPTSCPFSPSAAKRASITTRCSSSKAARWRP